MLCRLVANCVYTLTIGNSVNDNYSPSFERMRWKGWEEVGIEELFDTCYHVSVVGFVSETITPMKLTPAELKALTPVIQTFSDPPILQKVTKMLPVVCVAHKQLRGEETW